MCAESGRDKCSKAEKKYRAQKSHLIYVLQSARLRLWTISYITRNFATTLSPQESGTEGFAWCGYPILIDVKGRESHRNPYNRFSRTLRPRCVGLATHACIAGVWVATPFARCWRRVEPVHRFETWRVAHSTPDIGLSGPSALVCQQRACYGCDDNTILTELLRGCCQNERSSRRNPSSW